MEDTKQDEILLKCLFGWLPITKDLSPTYQLHIACRSMKRDCLCSRCLTNKNSDPKTPLPGSQRDSGSLEDVHKRLEKHEETWKSLAKQFFVNIESI